MTRMHPTSQLTTELETWMAGRQRVVYIAMGQYASLSRAHLAAWVAVSVQDWLHTADSSSLSCGGGAAQHTARTST